MQLFLTLLIFVLTYVLIAARRLMILPIGRPAGALCGAVLMIAVGAITPEESYHAINHDTIVLLFGTMLLTVYLDNAGFFEWTAAKVLGLCKTPMSILVTLSLLSAFLSAILVNDTVCLFLTPVIIVICLQANLPMMPFLIALATSANIGSAATLVGNPQNMIIGSFSKIHFATFLAYSGPIAAAGLTINIALLWLYYRKDLSQEITMTAPVPLRVNAARLRFVGFTTVLVLILFFLGFHLGYSALFGGMVLLLSERKDPRDTFARVDWALLVFFCCLFIVTAALEKTGLVRESWNRLAPYMHLNNGQGVVLFSSFMTAGSQIVSNVPMVLLTGPYLKETNSTFGWVLLAYVTTVAGNLTLIGSVANIIVAEKAKDHYRLGFWEYLRFGLVSTFCVLVAGVALLFLLMR